MEIKKYQKWTALVLVLCMLFSMTGCADEEKEAKQSFSKEDTPASASQGAGLFIGICVAAIWRAITVQQQQI